MRITYDTQYSVAYIGFRDARQPVHTIRVSDEIRVDPAPDGGLYGIESLNATGDPVIR